MTTFHEVTRWNASDPAIQDSVARVVADTDLFNEAVIATVEQLGISEAEAIERIEDAAAQARGGRELRELEQRDDVDPVALAHHKRALAYQERHGVTYSEAANATAEEAP